eukprot:307341-Rhodomonas_salina.1
MIDTQTQSSIASEKTDRQTSTDIDNTQSLSERLGLGPLTTPKSSSHPPLPMIIVSFQVPIALSADILCTYNRM